MGKRKGHDPPEGVLSDFIADILGAYMREHIIHGTAESAEKNQGAHSQSQRPDQIHIAYAAGVNAQYAVVYNPAHDLRLEQVYQDLAYHKSSGKDGKRKIFFHIFPHILLLMLFAAVALAVPSVICGYTLRATCSILLIPEPIDLFQKAEKALLLGLRKASEHLLVTLLPFGIRLAGQGFTRFCQVYIGGPVVCAAGDTQEQACRLELPDHLAGRAGLNPQVLGQLPLGYVPIFFQNHQDAPLAALSLGDTPHSMADIP